VSDTTRNNLDEVHLNPADLQAKPKIDGEINQLVFFWIPQIGLSACHREGIGCKALHLHQMLSMLLGAT
jgi:hypothetical protein